MVAHVFLDGNDSMGLRIRLLAVAALLGVGCIERTQQESELSKQPTDSLRLESSPGTSSDGSTSKPADPRAVAPAKSIAVGDTLESALAILDQSGFTKESAWQWGSNNPDARTKWRVIDDGVQIAIGYSDRSQLVTAVSMLYVPPDLTHRGNYQVITAEQVAFNLDGTYTVIFSKPPSKDNK